MRWSPIVPDIFYGARYPGRWSLVVNLAMNATELAVDMPESPSVSAIRSHILTPRSRSQRALVSTRRNHSSSRWMLFQMHLFWCDERKSVGETEPHLNSRTWRLLRCRCVSFRTPASRMWPEKSEHIVSCQVLLVFSPRAASAEWPTLRFGWNLIANFGTTRHTV